MRPRTPYPVKVIVWIGADSAEQAEEQANRLFPGHGGSAAVVVVNGRAVDYVTVAGVDMDRWRTTRDADQATSAPDTGELGEEVITQLGVGLFELAQHYPAARLYTDDNVVAAARAFQLHRSVAAAVNQVAEDAGLFDRD